MKSKIDSIKQKLTTKTGLTLSVIALFLIGVLTYLGIVYFSNNNLQNVIVTNQSSASVTVSGKTSDEQAPELYIVESSVHDSSVLINSNELVQFYDSRDTRENVEYNSENENASDIEISDTVEAKSRNFHHFEATSLNPETSYTVYERKFGIYKKIDNFRYGREEFKTVEVPESLNNPEPVYGDVINQDGQPVTDAIVYLQIIATEDISDVMSAPTNDSGSYYFDLSNALIDGETPDLDKNYSFKIWIESDQGNRPPAEFFAAETTPFRDLVIESGEITGEKLENFDENVKESIILELESQALLRDNQSDANVLGEADEVIFAQTTTEDFCLNSCGNDSNGDGTLTAGEANFEIGGDWCGCYNQCASDLGFSDSNTEAKAEERNCNSGGGASVPTPAPNPTPAPSNQQPSGNGQSCTPTDNCNYCIDFPALLDCRAEQKAAANDPASGGPDPDNLVSEPNVEEDCENVTCSSNDGTNPGQCSGGQNRDENYYCICSDGESRSTGAFGYDGVRCPGSTNKTDSTPTESSEESPEESSTPSFQKVANLYSLDDEEEVVVNSSTGATVKSSELKVCCRLANGNTEYINKNTCRQKSGEIKNNTISTPGTGMYAQPTDSETACNSAIAFQTGNTPQTSNQDSSNENVINLSRSNTCGFTFTLPDNMVGQDAPSIRSEINRQLSNSQSQDIAQSVSDSLTTNFLQNTAICSNQSVNSFRVVDDNLRNSIYGCVNLKEIRNTITVGGEDYEVTYNSCESKTLENYNSCDNSSRDVQIFEDDGNITYLQPVPGQQRKCVNPNDSDYKDFFLEEIGVGSSNSNSNQPPQNTDETVRIDLSQNVCGLSDGLNTEFIPLDSNTIQNNRMEGSLTSKLNNNEAVNLFAQILSEDEIDNFTSCSGKSGKSLFVVDDFGQNSLYSCGSKTKKTKNFSYDGTDYEVSFNDCQVKYHDNVNTCSFSEGDKVVIWEDQEGNYSLNGQSRTSNRLCADPTEAPFKDFLLEELNISSNKSEDESAELAQRSVLGSSDSIYFDPNSDSLFFDEAGIYYFNYQGEEYQVQIDEGQENTRIYVDENDNKLLDDEDQLLTNDPSELQLTKESEIFEYDLVEGYNMISFPFVPDRDYSTASGILSAVNAGGDRIESIAYFNGAWKSVNYNNELYSSSDFNIIPGKGYLIKANRNFSVSLSGKKIDNSGDNQAPVRLNTGWNLVGVYGTDTKVYTAESLIDDINNDSETNLNANNVTKFEKGTQRYDGLQKEVDEAGVEQVYGFDFPLSQKNGYFVRIQDGRAIFDYGN